MSDNKEKFRFEIKNQSDNNSEILIYGYIGKWEDVDYKGFRNSFQNILSRSKEVTVRIHSGGGSVYEGLAIYDLMRSSDADITVIVEGMAASMASIIALGGDKIKMTENAFFMMHAPSAGQWGDKTAMQSTVNQLEQAEKRLIEIYKQRTTADETTITDWMKPNTDTWLDSTKCLELSICDEVLKPSKERPFQANPESIKNKTAEEVFASYTGQIPNEIKNENNQKMKQRIISMLALAGITHTLTANSDDADFEKVLNDQLAKAQRCDTAEQALASANKANATALVEAAITAGKIPASEKEDWIKDAEANYSFAVKAIEKMSGKVDPNEIINRDKKVVGEQHELLKGREDWTFAKWQEEDPQGLEKMATVAPNEFEKLFNSQYKK